MFFNNKSIFLFRLDVGLVGHELKFTIDAARAGKGTVKVKKNFKIIIFLNLNTKNTLKNPIEI